MIIATWKNLSDSRSKKGRTFSEVFANEDQWEEQKFHWFYQNGGLPLWVVELSEDGFFVREWTLKLVPFSKQIKTED